MARLTEKEARDKIKALLNMTTDRGCTEAEAAAAAEAAARIAMQYNIDAATMSDFHAINIDDMVVEKVHFRTQGGWQWQWQLARTVAYVSSCRAVYRRPTRERVGFIEFFGTDFNAVVALAIYGHLMNTFMFLLTQETLTATAVRGVTGKKFAYAFLCGLTDRVCERLYEDHEDDIRQQAEAGTKYMVHMDKALAQFIEHFYPKLARRSIKQPRITNNDGYQRGRARGEHVVLRERKQLGGG